MLKNYQVLIGLDENMPDYLEGLLRVGSVVFLDEYKSSINPIDYKKYGIPLIENDLIDNEEFHSEVELCERIAERLGISKDDVIIE